MEFRRFPKLLALALVALMLFGFSACADDLFAEETTAPTTEPPAAGTTPIASADIKIGAVFGYAEGDASFFRAAHSDGIAYMKGELGLSDEQVVIKYSVTDASVGAALDELVEGGCKLIFGEREQFAQAMLDCAAGNPSVVFCCNAASVVGSAPNFEAWNVRVWEPYYLAGIAAGMKAASAQNPNVGFVAAQGTSHSAVTACVNAFALGARSVYEQALIKIAVTGEWFDKDKESAAARKLVDAGCGVVAQYAGSSSAVAAAGASGVFACGSGADCSADAPDTCLCSVITRYGVCYLNTARRVMSGEWSATRAQRVRLDGMDVGAAALTDVSGDTAAPGTSEAVASARADILSGGLSVFAGPINKADGSPAAAVGETLADDFLLDGIDYYIEGIEILP